MKYGKFTMRNPRAASVPEAYNILVSANTRTTYPTLHCSREVLLNLSSPRTPKSKLEAGMSRMSLDAAPVKCSKRACKE